MMELLLNQNAYKRPGSVSAIMTACIQVLYRNSLAIALLYNIIVVHVVQASTVQLPL